MTLPQSYVDKGEVVMISRLISAIRTASARNSSVRFVPIVRLHLLQ